MDCSLVRAETTRDRCRRRHRRLYDRADRCSHREPAAGDVECRVAHVSKINLSTVFAGQNVGVKQVSDRIWLVSFMQYDLGFFDDETSRLEPAQNPFDAKVLPMSPI